MKKLILLLLCLVSVSVIAQPSHFGPYDPGAARSNLSNVDATATPSMTSITLSDKIRAVWADILGDIYASGTVKVVTGTAAAPAYTFSSDPDTGIYSPGANVLGFTGNGAEKIRLGASGNLLIGTDNDTYFAENFLMLRGFAEGKGIIFRPGYPYDANTLDNMAIRGSSAIAPSGDGLSFSAYGGLSFHTGVNMADASNVRLAVSGAGNVLIATSTDDGANKLQVNGSMRLIGGAAPTATEGAIYFNGTDKHFYGYNGTAWVQLDN